MKSRFSRSRAGFTILELLVVIAVIGLLAALLLPALGGAQRRARKTEETAALRQVGIAFNFYATSNQDAALPGYLPPDVQNNLQDASTFAVNVRFPDGSPVPAALAATWPWRLAAQFDYDPSVLLGRRPLDDAEDLLRMSDGTLIDPGYSGADGVYAADTTRAETIAFQPAFGYNAFYVGGWYERFTDSATGQTRPRPRFHQATPYAGGPVGLSPYVTTRVSGIRSASLVLFCTTTDIDFNSSGSRIIDSLPSDRPGSHLAVPRYVSTAEVWRKSLSSARSSNMILQAIGAVPGTGRCTIPVPRHGDLVGTLRADLSVQPVQPGALDDQRLWINSATNPFQPTHQD